MQSLTFKLYPHKLFSHTVKCLLAAHIYNYPVEIQNDFCYSREYENEKHILANKKPLLTYEGGSISSTKAICFFLHRLRNKNGGIDAQLNFSLNWIEWCETFEECIETLNRVKLIESLNKLDHFLKEHQFINPNGGFKDQLTLADIFVYVTLNCGSVLVCKESWGNIHKYLNEINEMKEIQKVIQKGEDVYKFRNTYKLFISPKSVVNPNDEIKKQKFYITTAINYVNGVPHIGHAYEVVLADAIARYHRNFGRSTFFTTGADEHGIKIANQAKTNNLTPIELCNQNVIHFKELNRLLHISEDYYVRTTSAAHKEVVHRVWKGCKEKGDIYLGEYEGWYNIREETYIPENEAKQMNYIDPLNNIPLEKMKEPSYFFKMNQYQERLIQHIEKNPEFIQPEQKKNEILQRLKEPLLELSCSRTNFSWGISVPEDPEHVMYVWFDALLNYYSNCFIQENREQFWPPSLQIIGKDIMWFHSVIFPTILMSFGVDLPKTILSHGFVLAADGKKMSKSLGNVIDPFEIINTYGSDAFRYHLIKETKVGCDMRFDIDNLIDMSNSDLADILGNLVHRALSLCISNNDAKVPSYYDECSFPFPFNPVHFINMLEYHMSSHSIQRSCEETINICKDLNKYLTDMAPWKYKEEDKIKKLHIIRIMLESIYFIAHYLDMFIPSIASEIFRKLDTPKKCVVDLSPWFDNLQEGHLINNENILFKKFEVPTIQIQMQKVLLKVCRIVEVYPNEKNANQTICTVEVEDEEKYTAVLNLPIKENILNQYTLALVNMKPMTIEKYTISAIIPHVNQELFIFSSKDQLNLGTLIKAKEYPVLAKHRDKLTKKDINLLHLSIMENKCFFDKEIPLVFACSEQPLFHSSQLKGIVRFF